MRRRKRERREKEGKKLQQIFLSIHMLTRDVCVCVSMKSCTDRDMNFLFFFTGECEQIGKRYLRRKFRVIVIGEICVEFIEIFSLKKKKTVPKNEKREGLFCFEANA